MDTKVSPKSTRDFCSLIDMAECQALIKIVVADLAREHSLLDKAKVHPQPVDEQTRKLLGLGPNSGLSTLEMAEARVAYYESAQDRLWDWYRRLTDGG